ncbi:MAG: hypothetical protein AB1896_12565 [Thermodesulfobacteriota bacterium]
MDKKESLTSPRENAGFQLFPEERTRVDYPWVVWAMGLLAVFKSLLWIAYGTRYGWGLPDWMLRLALYRFLVFSLPFLIFGLGVWNFRRWAHRGLFGLALADLLISLAILVTFPDFYYLEPSGVYNNALARALVRLAVQIAAYRDIILDVLLLALAFPVWRLMDERAAGGA